MPRRLLALFVYFSIATMAVCTAALASAVVPLLPWWLTASKTLKVSAIAGPAPERNG